MEETKIIELAKREKGSKRFWLSVLYVFITAGLFIADLVFFISKRAAWNVVGLFITSTLLIVGVVATIYIFEALLFTKKLGDTPLVAYDKEKEEFIAYNFVNHREIRIKKDDMVKIKVSDIGEAFLWHKIGGKTRLNHIGYAFSGAEQLVNKQIKEIQNETKKEEDKE